MLYKQFIFSVLLLFLIATGLSAQFVIPAAGGDVKSAGSIGSMSYTIGQLLNSSSGGTLLYGVQNPLEVYIISDVKENGIEVLFKVYPNPTTENLVLTTPYNAIALTMYYQLYNLKGEVLLSEKIQSTQVFIPMQKYQPSTYLLKVLMSKDGNSAQELKVFKIIKK